MQLDVATQRFQDALQAAHRILAKARMESSIFMKPKPAPEIAAAPNRKARRKALAKLRGNR